MQSCLPFPTSFHFIVIHANIFFFVSTCIFYPKHIWMHIWMRWATQQYFRSSIAKKIRISNDWTVDRSWFFFFVIRNETYDFYDHEDDALVLPELRSSCALTRCLIAFSSVRYVHLVFVFWLFHKTFLQICILLQFTYYYSLHTTYILLQFT